MGSRLWAGEEDFFSTLNWSHTVTNPAHKKSPFYGVQSYRVFKLTIPLHLLSQLEMTTVTFFRHMPQKQNYFLSAVPSIKSLLSAVA